MNKKDFKILYGVYRKTPNALRAHSLFKVFQAITRDSYKTDPLIKNQGRLQFMQAFKKAFNSFCSTDITVEEFIGGIA